MLEPSTSNFFYDKVLQRAILFYIMFFVQHNVHTSLPSLYSFGEPCSKLVLSWAIKKSIKNGEGIQTFKVKSEFIH